MAQSVHTLNGQLVDREKIFAEFDKKCTGLELQSTTELKRKYLVFYFFIYSILALEQVNQ